MILMRLNKNLQRYTLYILLIAISAIYNSCKSKPDNNYRNKVTFKPVWGIKYTEVKQRLANGRSFSKYGYQLEPLWQLTFLSDDTARLYATNTKSFANFRITNDHDSIFYIARSWFRALKLTKDSLVFQVMKVESNVIYVSQSTLFTTLYSDDYIKNVLKTTPDKLRRPDRGDSLYVRYMITHPHKNPDSLFAARNPVVFKSKNPNIKVTKTEVIADETNRFSTTDSYLRPEYNIEINKAYKDFNYSFTAVVDERGDIRFHKLLVANVNNTNVIQAIIDGYLKPYLEVTPGSTLGMAQRSKVYINVKGRK